MFGRRMGLGRWGYWRPRYHRFFFRRHFFPGCGCGFLFSACLLGGLVLFLLTHHI